MNTFAAMNFLLIGLLVFTALLVWSRNLKRKRAYLERLKSHPDTFAWMARNLSGIEIQDLKAVAAHFGLPMLQAGQLIDFYRQHNQI